MNETLTIRIFPQREELVLDRRANMVNEHFHHAKIASSLINAPNRVHAVLIDFGDYVIRWYWNDKLQVSDFKIRNRGRVKA